MKLVWTEPSVEDLHSIRDYIARDSEHYAAAFVEQVIISVERLARFPRLGRIVPEVQNESVRELVYQGYRVIYRISGERIEILTVVHGSRDLTRRQTPSWEMG